MVEGDPHFAVEVIAKERDLRVPLTEVIQHDEFSVHLHPDADSLRGGAGKSFSFKHRSLTESTTQTLNFNLLKPKWSSRTPLFSSTISHVQGLM